MHTTDFSKSSEKTDSLTSSALSTDDFIEGK